MNYIHSPHFKITFQDYIHLIQRLQCIDELHSPHFSKDDSYRMRQSLSPRNWLRLEIPPERLWVLQYDMHIKPKLNTIGIRVYNYWYWSFSNIGIWVYHYCYWSFSLLVLDFTSIVIGVFPLLVMEFSQYWYWSFTTVGIGVLPRLVLEFTTIGIGRVRMKTPERAQKPPIIFPAWKHIIKCLSYFLHENIRGIWLFCEIR